MKYWYPLAKANCGTEERNAVIDCLDRQRTTMGEKVRTFEDEFSRMFVDGRECIMVNSGSSADLLSMMAAVNPMLQLMKAGDEILCPSVTWPTQIWSAVTAGLKVRLVDCNPATLNMDLADLEAKIGPNTKAIGVVHLMGNPVDMGRVMALAHKHSLHVFEDCCEILGARFKGDAVGAFGKLSAFSIFHTHHISTMEGGMVVAWTAETADLIRMLRAHGWTRELRHRPANPRFEFVNMGFNVRPTELAAAFGLEQLKRWPNFKLNRRQNAHLVRQALEPFSDWLQMPIAHPDAEPSWFGLSFIVKPGSPFTRDQLTAYLESAGVETRPIESGNMARHASMALFPQVECGPLPGAQMVHDSGFYIGLHPDSEGISRLIETIHTGVGLLVENTITANYH